MMPPKASPKTHTLRPHTALVAPANRDHGPYGATSNKSPTPTWIHTAAAAAVTGCSIQTLAPKLTRCCTHVGEPVEAGASTCDGMLTAIADWPWRIPSKAQMRPNPMRSTRWATGSTVPTELVAVAGVAEVDVPAVLPAARVLNCRARRKARRTPSRAP